MTEKIPVDRDKQRQLVAYVPALDDTVLVKANADGSLALSLTDEEGMINFEDIESVDWDGTALTSTEIQQLVDGGLNKSLPDTKVVTITLSKPIYTAEYFINTTGNVILTHADLNKSHWLADGSGVVVTSVNIPQVNNKIISIILTNVSGGALVIDHLILKKFTAVQVLNMPGTALITEKLITKVGSFHISGIDPHGEYTIDMGTLKMIIKRLVMVRTVKVGTIYTANGLNVEIRDAQWALMGKQHTLYEEEDAEPDAYEVVFNRTTKDFGELIFDPEEVDVLSNCYINVIIDRLGGDGTSGEDYQLVVQGVECV